MTDIDIAHEIPLAAQRPPVISTGVIGWLRANLFNSVFNTIRPSSRSISSRSPSRR